MHIRIGDVLGGLAIGDQHGIVGIIVNDLYSGSWASIDIGLR